MRMAAIALTATVSLILTACGGQMKSDDSEYSAMWICEAGKLKLYASERSYFDTGKIILNGKEIPASYSVDGLKHRWDWGMGEIPGDSTGYKYAITVGPDDWASYYNFGLDGDNDGIVTSSDRFNCSVSQW